MKDYLLTVYDICQYKNNPDFFRECIEKNGDSIAEKMNKANVYSRLKLFKSGEGIKKPRKSFLQGLDKLFLQISSDGADINKICASYKNNIYEKDNLYLYMWMMENDMFVGKGLIIYQRLLQLLGYSYEPAIYEDMENTILYIVLKTNSKCDVFCRLMDEWAKERSKYAPKLTINFLDNIGELNYENLLNEVLKNGFYEDQQKTRQSLSSINKSINLIVDDIEIDDMRLSALLDDSTIEYILDTYLRRQWYFLRIIQKTLEKQINDFVDLYIDEFNNISNRTTFDVPMRIMFLDFGKNGNSEIKESIENKSYAPDGIELENELKKVPISVSKIYNAFNTVFDIEVTDYNREEKFSKELEPELYYEQKSIKKERIVPYLFAPKKNRQKRHIIKGIFQSDDIDIDDELNDYYEEIMDEYYEYKRAVKSWTPLDSEHDEEYYQMLQEVNISQDQVLHIMDMFEEKVNYESLESMYKGIGGEIGVDKNDIKTMYIWNKAYSNTKKLKKGDDINPFSAKENGNNRKKMIMPLFLNKATVSREMLVLVLILSKVYGVNWTNGDVTNLLFNSRCNIYFNENSCFDQFYKDVFDKIRVAQALDLKGIQDNKEFVSIRAWKMEAEYLCLDGTARSKRDLDEGIAIFNSILKGEKVS